MKGGSPVRCLISAAVLMVFVLVCTYLLRSPDVVLDRELRLIVALVPVPVAVWMITEYVRLLRSADEFARRVTLESLAIAYPLALLLGFTVEYLQKGGFLLGADVGRLWPIQGLLWALAYAVTRWRYR